jgi:hypothetical protein
MNFEIHCRYNSSNPEAELEILYNDVTRTKTNEKHKAEYKYKTLFLSKVAHEFKNPLIKLFFIIFKLLHFNFFNLPPNSYLHLRINRSINRKSTKGSNG